MNNFVAPGKVITLTAPGGGVVSGVPVQIGQLFVIPAFTAAATEEFEGQVEGVFDIPKTGAQAWTEGQLVYWDGALATTVAAGNLLIGSASRFGGELAAADPGRVRLNGTATLQLP